MRGLIVIVAIICLLSACGTYTGKASKWDYYTPEHVSCFDKQTKLCRKYGHRMICECVA